MSCFLVSALSANREDWKMRLEQAPLGHHCVSQSSCMSFPTCQYNEMEDRGSVRANLMGLIHPVRKSFTS